MPEVNPALLPSAPAAYRTVTLSEAGRVLASEPLPALDDDEALMLALKNVGVFAVELWDGLRYIAHFPAMPSMIPLATEP